MITAEKMQDIIHFKTNLTISSPISGVMLILRRLILRVSDVGTPPDL